MKANMASKKDLSLLESTSEVESMAKFNTNFAFDLLRQFGPDSAQKGKTMMLAPYSITTALAMAYMGARGDTAREMKNVLQWSSDVPPEGFDSGLSLLKETDSEISPGYTIMGAQIFCVDSSYSLKPEFMSDLNRYFPSQVVKKADFRNNPEAERERINAWASEQTRGTIPELLPRDSIDSSTSMILAHGTYFKYNWLFKFDARHTREATFYSPDGQVRAYMMKQTGEFMYGEMFGFPAVELPFSISGSSQDLSMIIIMPDSNKGMDDLEEILDCEKLVRTDMRYVQLTVQLPRFRAETSLFLNEALSNLGMPRAFGEDADFSGMVEEGRPSISDFYHKVVVEVDEEGSAVTTTRVPKSMAATCEDDPHCQRFTVNRPFIFIISDRAPGSNFPCIDGRVVNP